MPVDAVVHAWRVRVFLPRVYGETATAGIAEAHLAEVLVEVRVERSSGTPGRAHVVEEPAPLVVDDEQRAALVVGRLHERVDHVGHERLAEPHVAERVLVGGEPVAAAAVAERAGRRS